MALHRNATAVIERHCVGLTGIRSRIHRDRANDAACVSSNLELQTVSRVGRLVDRAGKGLSITTSKLQRVFCEIGVRQREAAVMVGIEFGQRSRQIVGNVTRATRCDNTNVVNLARSQSHRN